MLLSRCSRQKLGPKLVKACPFSTSTSLKAAYADTSHHLLINNDTRVIYQGFTGKVATKNAQDTIEYGTNIVGGVSPGKGGIEHVGLPVYDTVRQAMEKVKPDASAIFVPALYAAKAIEEAIEAEVPLIVSVAEHIPVHDMLRVQEILQTQSKSRLVGPNCPGIIAPGRCRIGIMPYKQYAPGCVGIVSKSGTVSYEAVGATTAAGLGQSLVIGVGGDMLPGTTLADGLRVLLDDPQTKGIVILGEIGGTAEMSAASVLLEHNSGQNRPAKPVVGLVTGVTAPRGKTMGHAGALLSPLDSSAQAKVRALEAAGVKILPHPGHIGRTMKSLLQDKGLI